MSARTRTNRPNSTNEPLPAYPLCTHNMGIRGVGLGLTRLGCFPAPGRRVRSMDGRTYEMQQAGNLVRIY